jgi:hypothetical protein
MKVVINVCFGGFSLSPLAVKRLAELNGRECYFFDSPLSEKRYLPLTLADAQRKRLFFSAFDIPNPNEVLPRDDDWAKLSDKEREARHALYQRHALDSRPENRADPKLVQVVEELGEKANGACAELRVVEIPDGVEYEIDEYDGNEHIAETHRTWR